MKRKAEDKYLGKKQEIMECALDCFSRHGFAATTIKIIAAAADMKSTALIYYYFKDKDDLFQACMTDADIPPMSISMEAEPEDFIYQIQINFMDMINDTKIRKLLICSSSVIEERPDLMDQINDKYRQPYKEKFVEYIEGCKKRGIIRDIDAWQLYLDIFTPLFMRCIIVRNWMEWRNPEKRAEYEKVIRDRSKIFWIGIMNKK